MDEIELPVWSGDGILEGVWSVRRPTDQRAVRVHDRQKETIN